MGNNTKLQFRFSRDADALLMHNPSWEIHIDTHILLGRLPKRGLIQRMQNGKSLD